MARQQPEQQAPPAQWLRVQYAKRGPARFTSTRDFGRAFERALRRAHIPMAYSSGFNPHPRLSYANASPTSAATEAEYLEIGLSEVCDPDAVCAALDKALPPGLDVVRVVVSDRRSLNEVLTASRWRIELDPVGEGDIDPAALERAVASLLAAEEFSISRMTKTGMRHFDVRGAIIELTITEPTVLELLAHHTTPLVRPDDVVRALRQIEPVLEVPRPALLTRLTQGELRDGELLDAMRVGG
ncbi:MULTISPECIES: TIGR03936 family radical SAM-associated protein [unclassified Luteococcus]|uniref:TIGR03936 family radical SAM-associated protein n=1 Tax=unclassified Luteococcus TaxID=2639923 RepID=UPI00313EF080